MNNRLRKVRTALGVSQDELRRRSGVGAATISRIENGHGVARASTKKKIAHALGVPVRFIWPVRGIS